MECGVWHHAPCQEPWAPGVYLHTILAALKLDVDCSGREAEAKVGYELLDDRVQLDEALPLRLDEERHAGAVGIRLLLRDALHQLELGSALHHLAGHKIEGATIAKQVIWRADVVMIRWWSTSG